jgi:hypothetical protein
MNAELVRKFLPKLADGRRARRPCVVQRSSRSFAAGLECTTGSESKIQLCLSCVSSGKWRCPSTGSDCRGLFRKLLLNPLRQGVGEHQHVSVVLIIGSYVECPVVVQPTNHLGGRQINVLLQRCFQIRLRSVRISTAEKGGNLIGICRPFFARPPIASYSQLWLLSPPRWRLRCVPAEAP